MVHHDDALGRLTEGSGRLAEMTAAEIKKVRFLTSGDRILTLERIVRSGRRARTPVLLELKSHFDNDRRLAQRVADVLAAYSGPVAVMSFDPAMIEVVRWIAPHLTRGIVAERHYADREWDRFPPAEKRRMAFLLHANRTRPHFIAYGGEGPAGAGAADRPCGLPAAAADLDRAQRGRPGPRRALGRSDHFRGNSPVNGLKVGLADPPMTEIELRIRIAQSLADVPAAAWDACAARR